MAVGDSAEPANEVRLVGRVSGQPVERVLPSGDVLWTVRVVVDRPRRRGTEGTGRPTVDALECAVWGGRPRRAVRSWRSGDVVEVAGALRRRFFRTASGTASRVEVEVGSARLIRRASTA